MNKNVRAAAMVTIIVMALGGAWSSRATRAQQANTGSVCVLAFDDANRNGYRDPGENLLKDVNVSLMINQTLIVANHVTDGTEPFCFTNLSPQQYTISFSSPLYEATTSSTFTFSLSPDERATRDFGAVARTSAGGDTVSVSAGLSLQQRLGLSAFCAAIVMTGMTGLGMMIAYLIYRSSLRR
jgi:hypothetical protein